MVWVIVGLEVLFFFFFFFLEFGFNFKLVRSESSSNVLMMRFVSVGRCLSYK